METLNHEGETVEAISSYFIVIAGNDVVTDDDGTIRHNTLKVAQAAAKAYAANSANTVVVTICQSVWSVRATVESTDHAPF